MNTTAAPRDRILAMTASDIQRELDNPFWSSLTTRHAHFAQGGTLARRYPATISPLAGLPGVAPANIAALAALVEVDGDVATVGPFVPTLPRNWKTLYESQVTQMIRVDRSLLPESNVDASILGPTDVAEMLALVDLTKPGPFRPRTIELGTYLGIREGGRLVAMAGERTWVGDFREVSAICTHPDAQRRGYARALMGRVINRMLRAGETPFLHVESSNLRAIDVYLALGFIRRTEFRLLHARRIS
jgi:ribosomal protein S18 acetylase RimI-like enzyme